jgi:hypothetical protein
VPMPPAWGGRRRPPVAEAVRIERGVGGPPVAQRVLEGASEGPEPGARSGPRAHPEGHAPQRAVGVHPQVAGAVQARLAVPGERLVVPAGAAQPPAGLPPGPGPGGRQGPPRCPRDREGGRGPRPAWGRVLDQTGRPGVDAPSVGGRWAEVHAGACTEGTWGGEAGLQIPYSLRGRPAGTLAGSLADSFRREQGRRPSWVPGGCTQRQGGCRRAASPG